eukprot:NODE_44_length_33449_cov_1.575742.p34 type:complete len:127 gc:universal NODE_44_length_33449_cov_1.575742:33159-32779(-)
MFSSESDEEIKTHSESIFNKEVNIEEELKKAVVPKPMLKTKKEPTIEKAHYLEVAANKRAEEKAKQLSKQLDSIKEKKIEPNIVFKTPTIHNNSKSLSSNPLKKRDLAIEEYKKRFKKRKIAEDLL